jgi:hypothetical protein
MTQKIRHKLQPREEIEVSDQEAEVLKAQGLLFEGDIDELLAADPSGPLDPPHKPQTATQAPKPTPTTIAAATPSPATAAAKES